MLYRRLTARRRRPRDGECTRTHVITSSRHVVTETTNSHITANVWLVMQKWTIHQPLDNRNTCNFSKVTIRQYLSMSSAQLQYTYSEMLWNHNHNDYNTINTDIINITIDPITESWKYTPQNHIVQTYQYQIHKSNHYYRNHQDLPT